MIVSAADVADTLRLLVPGFLMTKVFYHFGLQTRRSDAQWVIWSLLAAAPVNALADSLEPKATVVRGLVVVVIALAAGGVLAILWRRLAKARPALATGFTIRAWDNLFLGTAPWLQVETLDGRVISGWPKYAAKSLDTDDLDIYLSAPRFVEDGKYVDLPGVDGILVARSRIAYISAVG